MKISLSATNPCHIYDQALGLHELGHLGILYNGYPQWKLSPPEGMHVKGAYWRTVLTYGIQRLPSWARRLDDGLFRWQDIGFDSKVARLIPRDRPDFFHGVPGQSLASFKEAERLGIPRALNHASGPLDQQRELIRPEYERVGIELESLAPIPGEWKERLKEEWELASVHCAASTVVRDQLIQDGIDPETIWVVPYGVDPEKFPKRSSLPDGPFKICFAGRQTLRKGLIYLLRALEKVSKPDWELHLFGMEIAETAPDLAGYAGKARLLQHGPVSQRRLAEALQGMSLLVLPSAEEAFGLVVAQALQCGVPCLVSNRVGAKDLIRPGTTGDEFPFGDVDTLAEQLCHWERNRIIVEDTFPRREPADHLLGLSRDFVAREGGAA
jgi:glycosyltransferase involved in cell wall biosynthesis